MGINAGLLEKIQQIGGRIEDVPGTSKTLNAFDYKARIVVGAGMEYDAPRENRNLASDTLTRKGAIEGKKATKLSCRTEINTPDAFDIVATATMDLDAIEWQAPGVGDSNNIVRYTAAGVEDLSAVVPGDYFTCNYDANAINNGTFLIIAVNDGSDYVDVINRQRTSVADDVASGSTGIGDVQSAFEHSWMLECSSVHIEGLSRVPIGAIAGGPFHFGETITGAGGATGRIVVPHKTGDSFLYFEVLTGKFVSELITGGSSGATATSSGGPEVHGLTAKPISDCQEVATIEVQKDGYAMSTRSAMGNMTAQMDCNKQGFMDFVFDGPRLLNGDKVLTPNVVRYTEKPPVMKTANLKFNATTDNFEPVFTTVALDLGHTVVLRQNGNAADDTGFETARIPDREPKITISLEHELAATFDYFKKLDDGIKVSLEYHIGTVETKQFWFFAPELEYTQLPMTENDGIITLDLEASLTHDTIGDGEWQMVWIGN